jgi:OOP family OmpA-OmpF porin
MKAMRCLFLCVATLCAVQMCGAQEQDAKGCVDSPLVTRFPGSVIVSCTHKDGEIIYTFPQTASGAQVRRNFATALRSAGYTFERDPSDNARGNFVAHMGKTWINIEFNDAGSRMWENIVVETVLKQEVVATAAAMSNGLTNSGHTVVNGILFDTGKAEVKPESAPALQEIVKLMQQQPTLKIYVVGHTDNVGGLAANLDLSFRRATAIVHMLVTQYHLAADRLQPFGAGPYAPVAPNGTEDGRSLNRRVELVMH